MKTLHLGAKGLVLSGVLFVFGCHSAQQPAPSTEEASVRQTDENWNKAAQSKKVDDWVAFYSDDAVVLPPNEKKVDSKESVRKEIGTLLALPGLAIHWAPVRVEVARSGDLAYTQGSYQMTALDAHGKPGTEQGKTLEIWKKQADGSWKCVADMWSSDLPATPQ